METLNIVDKNSWLPRTVLVYIRMKQIFFFVDPLAVSLFRERERERENSTR